MQYGFNTPGYGPYNCCGDTSTCTGPCPADFCSTPTGYNGVTNWNGGFTGYAPNFNGYNGVTNWNGGFTGYAPSFTGYNGVTNWNGGFTGYAPNFTGYNGVTNWNGGFTGYAPNFNGFNGWTPGFTGNTGWNPGFTGTTGYANVPGTSSTTGGNSTMNNCGPCWTGGCATEAA